MARPDSLRIAAPAKLNLFLHITGKRADGYHLLESLVVFTEFGDRLDIEPADALSLEITGPFAPSLQLSSPLHAGILGNSAVSPKIPAQGGDDGNLVMRAARMLQAHTGYEKGAHITLHKHIPVGAGLGGGSADAAAVLRGLMALWNVSLENSALHAMALQLGSDVPVCLASQAAWMSGIGENIAPVGLDVSGGVVLVNPGVPLLTADVFRRFPGTFAISVHKPESMDSMDALLEYVYDKQNMLEKPACVLLPVTGEVLSAIDATPGCRLARMSGSGATCFGLYDDAAKAQLAADALKREHPDWWCMATCMKEPV